ncbi:MAG: quinone oxidoreductase family protein [Bacteroidota bacterium]
MKSEALFLTKYGDSSTAFTLRETEIPKPLPGEVLVEVEAFGLNYADVMARKKLYREAPPLPCVLGYEVVGKVISTGSHESHLTGKRVVAFTRFGGYARHVCTSVDAIAEIGDLEADKALAIATQYVTAYYMATYLAPIRPGEKILIHAAAGGVGTALIQLAKKQGALVYAKVSSAEKCSYVSSIGADQAINYTKGDYEKQLDKERFDAIFNPVAGSTFKKDLRLLNPGGKLFLYGGSELLRGKFGFFSTLNFLRKMGLQLPVALMMRSRSLLGVNMLQIADHTPEVLKHCLDEVVRMCRAGDLELQPGTIFPALELAKAHTLLESGKSIGKIAVKW